MQKGDDYRVSQEMKYCTVMPQIKMFVTEFVLGDVPDMPANLLCSRAQSVLCEFNGCC